jgi:hypothetical protein
MANKLKKRAVYHPVHKEGIHQFGGPFGEGSCGEAQNVGFCENPSF